MSIAIDEATPVLMCGASVSRFIGGRRLRLECRAFRPPNDMKATYVQHKRIPPAYVGFGMLTPVTIMVRDRLPRRNTGALVREFSEFVFDDAAIIACALRQWGVLTGMIGTAVGDDRAVMRLPISWKNGACREKCARKSLRPRWSECL